MKIRLLVLTLLIIGVHQHIQAQYMLGTTGMMNIPTADRQKPGTVMLGGNYLPKQMMPARFDYNTGNYFVSISFMPKRNRHSPPIIVSTLKISIFSIFPFFFFETLFITK